MKSKKKKQPPLVMDFELLFQGEGRFFKESTGVIRRRVYESKKGRYILYKGYRMPVESEMNVILPRTLVFKGNKP